MTMAMYLDTTVQHGNIDAMDALLQEADFKVRYATVAIL